jgi:outer membrane protein assembly factor BamA
MARRVHIPRLLALLLLAAQAAAGDSLAVPAELRLEGQRQTSTLRLRRLLGAGETLEAGAWRARLDSLARLYEELGHPFLEARAQVDSSAQPPRLLLLELDEGPRLVMGRLELDPPRSGLPDPARDLPPGSTLTTARLEEGLRAWLGRLAAQGRPLAVLHLKELALAPMPEERGQARLALDLRAALADADTVRPGRLVVLDEGLTRQRTFERLARLAPGRPYDPRRAEDARRRLLATGWFSRLEGPLLCATPQGPAWLLRAGELPAYRFDGLLAWLPGQGGAEGRLAYHASLELANLMGTGRELRVLASRPEGLSQELKVAYREPFVAGWPLDAGVHVRQRVQDSSWVELEAGLELGWEPRPGLRLRLGALSRELAPDSLNGYWRAGVDASRAGELVLGLEIDQRDDPRNPRRGWRAGLEEALLRRRLSSLHGLPPRGKDLALRRQVFQAGLWLPLPGLQVCYGAAGAGRLSGRGGGQVPGREDLFLLGGAAGPRGSRDESIRVREWALGTLEWRLLLGPVSRVALFWDALSWRDTALVTHLSQGRGAALVLPVRQGQLELQYALAPGLRWREGLLHVRMVTRF